MGKSQAALDQMCLHPRETNQLLKNRYGRRTDKSIPHAVPQPLGWELCHYGMTRSNGIENQFCFSAVLIEKCCILRAFPI